MSSFLFEKPLITYLLILSNVLVFILVLADNYFSFTFSSIHMLEWGANFNPYTLDKEWWRIFTSMFLHFGLIHLLVNMLSLFSLGIHLEKDLGKINFIILYLLSGIASGLASLYWNLFTVSAGASGAILGLFGFYMVTTLIDHFDDNALLRPMFASFVIFIVLNFMFQKAFNIDVPGHLGGFGLGIVLAVLTRLIPLPNSISKFRFIGSSLTMLILSLFIFFNLPTQQLEYFKAFQLLLTTEKQTTAAINKYTTDEEYSKDLLKVIPLWSKSSLSFRKIKNLPIDLQPDVSILKKYIHLKIKEAGYKIETITKESFIYWDSTEWVGQEIRSLPKIKYGLDFSSAIEEQMQPLSDKPLKSVKVYYDSAWQEIDNPSNAVYFRLGTKDSSGFWTGPVRDYFIDGKIQMKGSYSKNLKDGVFIYYSHNNKYEAAGRFSEEKKVGKWQYFHSNGSLQSETKYNPYSFVESVWDSLGRQQVTMGNGEEILYYSNGTIKQQGTYRSGERDGYLTGYHSNGTKYFVELYSNGKLIKGAAQTLDGQKYFYDESVYFPRPEGGWGNFYKYLKEQKRIPKEAIRNNVFGKIAVLFDVDSDGSILDVKFQKPLGYGYEEEAKRLLLNGPKWIPSKLYGYLPYRTQTLVFIDFSPDF